MGTLLAIIFDVGFIASFFVYGTRAGLGDVEPNWREFLLPNIGWFLMLVGKTFVWPLVLSYWLYKGRPTCPWKAVDQLPDGHEVRQIIRLAPSIAM
jgi:hypothetical protein